jgi:uroporphyrinogen-III decarboxylase
MPSLFCRIMNPSAIETGQWTSRRRLLTALGGGAPDRVPINTYELAGRNSMDWYNQQPSYAWLMEYIRAHTDCITNWNPRAATDQYTCHERFLCSDYPVLMELNTEPAGEFQRTTRIVHTPRGPLRSVTQTAPDVYTTWNVEHWCKDVADVDKALSVSYQPAEYDASDLPRVRTELGEHGLIMASIGDPAYLAAELMSFQDCLMWIFEETEHFAGAVAMVAERVMENLRRQLECCVVDFYRIVGPEFFTPPYLPPDMFRRFVVPHVTEMTQLIHAKGAKVRVHSHGKIGRVLDMMLETGCDGIDPCEPPPDGDLALSEVKRRCQAAGVSVWGNMEFHLLENGTPGQVRTEVRNIMEQAKDGGGFVLMPSAAPINLPLAPQTEANYQAFIDAGLEFGGY